MLHRQLRARTKIALAVSSIVLLACIYFYMSHRQHQKNPKDTTIPNVSQIVHGWHKLITPDASGERWLLVDSWATAKRLLLGLLMGSVLALIIGMSMGCFTEAEAFCKLPLSFFAKIPPTAMLAVYFVLVGTQMKMFIAMISLGIFPTLAQSIYAAAKKDVHPTLIDKAYTLGASHMEVIWNVIYKQILPRIIENIRLQIGPAMVFLIAAEWAVADVGFGYRLRIQSRLLNMNVVYTYLAILAGTGFLMDWGLSATRRKLCGWFGE